MPGITSLQSRYLFQGDLVLQTALHIGGGDAILGATDSPVIRSPDARPFIPGSSLKGAFRSTVEKLAATLELKNMERDALDLSSEWIKAFNDRRTEEGWDEEQTLQEVEQHWPVTALLFGTPYTASHLSFSDAYLCEGQDSVIQRRDGVAIDRDSERATDRLKYDYEVVPSTLRFEFRMMLENPSPTDVSLTCLGLSELVDGFFSLGGKRSSGLGRCCLENVRIFALDLTEGGVAEKAKRLQRYLTGKTLEDKFGPPREPREFIEKHIENLISGGA